MSGGLQGWEREGEKCWSKRKKNIDFPLIGVERLLNAGCLQARAHKMYISVAISLIGTGRHNSHWAGDDQQ